MNVCGPDLSDVEMSQIRGKARTNAKKDKTVYQKILAAALRAFLESSGLRVELDERVGPPGTISESVVVTSSNSPRDLFHPLSVRPIVELFCCPAYLRKSPS